MKAIIQDRYGSTDVLRLGEVDLPVVADNEVLIRVRAASVNAYDWHAMRGDPYLVRLAFGLRAPKRKVRGRDFAGRVEAVGRDVTRLHPGDDVYGDLGSADGAFAEYVSVPEHLVESKPTNLSFEQAAAMPLAGNTALICLRDAARVRPGERVLINGASGGVGTFAVQIAKALGAEVTGVCSTRNADLVRSIGADHVIDYTVDDFAQDGSARDGSAQDGSARDGSAGDRQRYDVVLDLVGNRSLTDCRRVLTPTGTLVLSGGGAGGDGSDGGSLIGPVGLLTRGRALAPFVRHRLVAPATTPNRENLVTLRELAEAGKITPIVDRCYPLREVPEAIRYVEVEHARAKVVITL